MNETTRVKQTTEVMCCEVCNSDQATTIAYLSDAKSSPGSSPIVNRRVKWYVCDECVKLLQPERIGKRL